MATKKYTVESPIRMDGEWYEIGDEIELEEDTAEDLPVSDRKPEPATKPGAKNTKDGA